MMNLMHFDYAQYKQKGFAPILVLVGILIIIAVAGGANFFGKLPIKPTDNNPKACTQEAKQCPDGSFVGRTGYNCEFSPCPSVAPKASDASSVSTNTDETANWKTYNDNERGFSLKYPLNWDNAFDYCSILPDADSNELSPNCIRTVIFMSDIPDENANLGRDLILTSSTNINVAGYDAKRKLFSVSENTPDTYEVWLYKNNKPIMLWLSYIGSKTSKKQGDNFVQIFDQMLSTFKFTN